MSESAFQPDDKIRQIAEAYALDAVDFAAQNFKIKLDGSEASIELVENMLDRLHKEMAKAKPDEKTIWLTTKALGSYVGETMIRHHGGEWGMIQMGSDKFPGIRRSNGGLCWPWGKVHKRLINGDEDNVWHYYMILTREH